MKYVIIQTKKLDLLTKKSKQTLELIFSKYNFKFVEKIHIIANYNIFILSDVFIPENICRELYDEGFVDVLWNETTQKYEETNKEKNVSKYPEFEQIELDTLDDILLSLL